MNAALVNRIREYHVLDGEGDEQVLAPVTPIRQPQNLRAVWIGEGEAEILENVGMGLNRLGAVDAGSVLLGIALAWKAME